MNTPKKFFRMEFTLHKIEKNIETKNVQMRVTWQCILSIKLSVETKSNIDSTALHHKNVLLV